VRGRRHRRRDRSQGTSTGDTCATSSSDHPRGRLRFPNPVIRLPSSPRRRPADQDKAGVALQTLPRKIHVPRASDPETGSGRSSALGASCTSKIHRRADAARGSSRRERRARPRVALRETGAQKRVEYIEGQVHRQDRRPGQYAPYPSSPWSRQPGSGIRVRRTNVVAAVPRE